jgi:hypothetical protein
MNPANEVYFAMGPDPCRRSGPAALNYTDACGQHAAQEPRKLKLPREEMVMRRTLMWIPAVLLATACGGEAGGEAGWAGTVEDSAGVQLVKNTLTPVWGEGEAWVLEDVMTIGEAAGDPDYQFGQISGIVVTADGRIILVDQQAQHVKVFGPDGSYERTIGQGGSGPGEFGPGVGPILIGRGDTLIVPDLGNQRVNILRSDGSEPASFRMSFDQGIPARWDMTEAGDLVYQLRALNLPNTEQRDTLDLIATVSYAGEIIDTLMTPKRGESLTFGDDGQPIRMIFSPEPVWSLIGGDGLCIAVNDIFRLNMYDAGGVLDRIVTLPVERKPVTDADIESFMQTVERLLNEQGLPPETIEIVKSTFNFADYFPAFLQMMPGPNGSLWVQRVQEPTGMTAEEREAWNPLLDLGASEWDILDAEGRYLGMLDMPHRFQPVTFEGDLMYGIWRDEFDVQYVRVMKITGMGEDSA